MIVYGSRMYFKKDVVKSHGECQYCGDYAKQKSYKASKFGHIYFIPLIPLGGQKQILNECSVCGMGNHVSLADLDPMVDSLADRFKGWIMEIQDGATEIAPEPGEAKVNSGVLIAGIIEDLYCLKEIENIDSINAIFDANNMRFEKEIVQGRWNEIQGNLDQARNHYESAHRANTSDPLPLYQMGMASTKGGDIPGAEEAFGKYMKLKPDDPSPYYELAGLYECQWDYPKIVTTYDAIFTMTPEILSNKKVKKLYKKACKKSGQQGKFLAQM